MENNAFLAILTVAFIFVACSVLIIRIVLEFIKAILEFVKLSIPVLALSLLLFMWMKTSHDDQASLPPRQEKQETPAYHDRHRQDQAKEPNDLDEDVRLVDKPKARRRHWSETQEPSEDM